MNKIEIDIRDPILVKGIADAERDRKLDDLGSEDRTYLLSCFSRSYGELLSSAAIGPHPELLSVLLEFAAIAHILPTDSSKAVLQQWAGRFEAKPRCLTSIPQADAFQAPVRGVGSPNGVVVTTFSDENSLTPTRICIAGTTPDSKFNAQLFNTLFATALACESEPTFVTSNASILTLGQADLTSSPFSEPLLTAVLGPAGPVEPDPDTPSVGIGSTESMLLAWETFGRLQDYTGLLKVASQNGHEGRTLDETLSASLRISTPSEPTVIASSQEGEPSSVVHLTPLIHRDAAGQIVPITIEIPYRVVGGFELFQLLRSARSTYMRQLLEETRRRLAMAWQVYNEHRRILEKWFALTEGEKATVFDGSPPVTITGSYDFRRAVIVPLPEPRKISRREFEETVRPAIVQQAKTYGEAFQRLCDKLQSLDSPGGRADVLTFKLLFDSMLRQAPLQVESQALQDQYRKWANVSSVAVWAKIGAWALQHGIAPLFLASDSVIYNCTLNVETNAITIRPWVAIDLRDFTAIANRGNGTIAVYPAGKAKRLADIVISDDQSGITDLMSLHRRFNDWLQAALKSRLSASELRRRHELFSNRKIVAVVELTRAKRLLFRGRVEEALAHLASVRNADLAPIYFWAAVAGQLRAQMLERSHMPGNYLVDYKAGRLQVLDEDSKFQLQLQQTLETLRGALESKRSSKQFALAPGVHEYLAQLRAKDNRFVRSFLSPDCEIHEIETESLQLSQKELTQVEAALAAAGSLEFLHLAEELTRAADRLPASGTVTTHVKNVIQRILDLANDVSAREIPEGAQLKTLQEFLHSG